MNTPAANFSVLYIPHGGGPLPLMNHDGHRHLVDFLKTIPERLGQPEAILVISAHWEEAVPTITGGASPPLFYDYYGFPPEAYKIDYPAPGCPDLARDIHSLLVSQGMKSCLDLKRGFDHGVFIPLKLMYPDAGIPCVQLSLIKNLNPLDHLKLGRALMSLQQKNILVLGSGFSFHNMRAFGDQGPDKKNHAFDQWLKETLSHREFSSFQIQEQLAQWEKAPHARYCHPREEHLLPLHVCFGITQKPGQVVFNNDVLGKKATAFLWQE